MRTSLVLALTITGLTLGAASASAQSNQYPHVSGTACVPATPTYSIYRGGFGLWNTSSSSTLSVVCAIPYDGTSLTGSTVTSNGIRIDYSDADSNSGQAISCNELVQYDYTYTYTASRYSCSTSGGCTSGSNTFTGTGYLTLPAVPQQSNVKGVIVYCNIPAWQSGQSISALISVAADLSVQ